MSRSFTRRLLLGGAVSGPLFVAMVLLQMLLRDGFDIRRHPISLLSLGPGGWVQVANFVLAGVLVLGLAVAARQCLGGQPAGRWGPILLAGYGAGLVAGGVFVADPGLGFPPGAPAGIPETLTWHGTLHAVAPPLAFTALVAATAVFARRSAAYGRPGRAAYSALSGLTALLLAVPGPGFSLRLLLAVVVTGAWTTVLAADLLRTVGGPDQASTSEGCVASGVTRMSM